MPKEMAYPELLLVRLSEADKRKLKLLAERERTTVAEIVRRLLDHEFAEHPDLEELVRRVYGEN